MPWADVIVTEILEQLMRGTAPTLPVTFYFGLSTTDPLIDGSGVTEPSGGSYARVAKTRNTTNFDAAASRAILNLTAITFPTATADWGLCGWVVIYDASTAGVFQGYGDIPDQNILSGMTPSWPIAALSFSLPST